MVTTNPAGKRIMPESRCCGFPDQKVCELPMIWNCKGAGNLLKMLTRLLQVLQSGRPLHLQDRSVLESYGGDTCGDRAGIGCNILVIGMVINIFLVICHKLRIMTPLLPCSFQTFTEKARDNSV